MFKSIFKCTRKNKQNQENENKKSNIEMKHTWKEEMEFLKRLFLYLQQKRNKMFDWGEALKIWKMAKLSKFRMRFESMNSFSKTNQSIQIDFCWKMK